MPERLTADEVAAIRERLGKATPGPWYTVAPMWLPRGAGTYVIAGHYDPHVGTPVLDCIDIEEWDADQPGPDYSQSDADMEFAAHAREDIPRLLATLEAVTRERDAMTPVVGAVAAHVRAWEAEMAAPLFGADRQTEPYIYALGKANIAAHAAMRTAYRAFVALGAWRALTGGDDHGA